MKPAIHYTDCHIRAYCRYVRTTSASAVVNGPQTLPFRDWFHDEYQVLPGDYVGINHLPGVSST